MESNHGLCHDLLSSDELITNWYFFVQKWHSFKSYSSNVHRLVEDTSDCERDEKGGDDWQEEIDILSCLKHDYS